MFDTEDQARGSAGLRSSGFASRTAGSIDVVRRRFVLVCVAVAHLLAISYLWSARIIIQTPPARGPTTTLILDSTTRERQPSRADIRTLVERNPPHIVVTPVVVSPPGAPNWEPTAPETQSPLMDWTRAARLAAARAVAESGHNSSGAGPNARPPAAKPSQTFSWSHANTHRIERAEDGTVILWLNERCFLVGFLIPVCAVGEIKPRGDLFNGMRDPKEIGDLP
jgi:hypothetical protein